VILDASALLALLQDEAGAHTVRAHLPESAITAINLEEVVGLLVREGMASGDVDRALSPLAIPVLAFTERMALIAGRLRGRLPGGLGVADRCCLAAAADTGRSVVTADTLWEKAAAVFGVKLILIR
jgi:PIN domain nuclease of toxin-antitoxin system